MIPLRLGALGPITDGVTGEHWTGQQLRTEALQRCAALAARGIARGSRVLLLHGNSPAFFADLLAVWLRGATAACADPAIGPADFASMTAELQPDLVITSDELPSRVAEAAQGMQVAASGEQQDFDRLSIDPDVAADDPALILFTSGSTGLPKGVVHTFRTLTAKWMGLRHHVPLERCRTTLCALPTHFGHGLICNALYPLVHGCHLIVMPRLDLRSAANLPDVLARFDVTFMSSVPAMWRLVLQMAASPDRPTLEQVHIGSAPLSAELWAEVQRWSGTRRVWNTYGITETGSWVAGPVDEPEPDPADGLVGQGWNSEILIAPADADVAELTRAGPDPVASGETGQVLLRTPDLMVGYLDRPEATREVVLGTWLRTGDLGYLDDRNRLVLVGRERNEINKGGIKISPEEIDLTIERHPDVAEACAFRVDDELLGEDLEVAVQLRTGAELSARDVTTWTQDQLTSVKVPRLVHIVDEIPKTARGKVNRDQVAAHLHHDGQDGRDAHQRP